jgi:hypothetical protein
MSPARAIALASTVALLGACHDPAGDVTVSWLRADVAGAVEDTYEGTGDFYVGAGAEGIRKQFGIASKGVGAAAGNSLLLYRPGAGRPAVGSYVLAPLGPRHPPQGCTAYYSRRANGRVESFTARAGRVDITKSSDDRVEGTFWFAGPRYCSDLLVNRFHGDEWRFCNGTNTIDLSQPQVEVRGSLAAVRWTSAGVVEHE